MKVSDIGDLQEVGWLAHERDPEKYPYTHLTSLTSSNYVAGNPLYDILHDGRTVFDGPPLLSLSSIGSNAILTEGSAVTEWYVDMPRLATWTSGSCRFPGVRKFRCHMPNAFNLNGGLFGLFSSGPLEEFEAVGGFPLLQ